MNLTKKHRKNIFNVSRRHKTNSIMTEIQHRITKAKIHPVEKTQFRHINSIICKDGFTVSIQAGPSYYSRPRNLKGPYTHVEMGHASGPMPSLKKWKEGNIWTFVPLQLAAQVINNHGGLVKM